MAVETGGLIVSNDLFRDHGACYGAKGRLSRRRIGFEFGRRSGCSESDEADAHNVAKAAAAAYDDDDNYNDNDDNKSRNIFLGSNASGETKGEETDAFGGTENYFRNGVQRHRQQQQQPPLVFLPHDNID
jgi:hypothetical protein